MAAPALTVLMLDTAFPRIPGDVACPASYREPVEILRVPVTVAQAVHWQPELLDVAPFEAALARARGELVTTSCGFLAPWHDHLARLADRPFLASVLNAPPVEESLLLTYDACALGPAHLAGWRNVAFTGLPPDGHLRDVIGNGRDRIDFARAEAEVVATVHQNLTDQEAVVLECTNLPPFAPALRMATERPVHHILTALEALRPGLVRREFLTAG
ncbi:hypothetical protein [Jannaschia aquimarina]|uniref:Asp/Glu/Hydantoin racemase n=1 Tax=Jannaschia aquimarina TaxID=935700 RepID=A0A0D1CSY8_9RHOB|nr:hypothetical protein [Jannaschia aquimarina]KIT17872.1 hypothetical protein jaqu_03800 [Jannaschia aquimarina]SNS55892.1 hypothetical protein SAMN05421775_101431 [Jannaschia aquimarina]